LSLVSCTIAQPSAGGFEDHSQARPYRAGSLIRFSTLVTMNRITRLWTSLAAALTVSLFTFLALPGVAWAADDEYLRRRPSGVGFWGCSAICCLVVVGGIVAAIYLITRNRRRS